MPGASGTKPMRFGLATRIFVGCALLVVAVLGATFGVTTLRANRTADESIHRALVTTRRAVTDYLGARTRTLAGLSQVSARVPQFRERLLASRERANVLDQAQEYRDLIGAAWILVTDDRGILLARTDYPGQYDLDLSRGALIGGALSGSQTQGAWLDDVAHKLFIAVATPLAASAQATPQGVLVAAYALDDSLAQAVKQATNSDVVFFALDTLSHPLVVGSTLPRDEVAAALTAGTDSAALALLSGRPSWPRSRRCGAPWPWRSGSACCWRSGSPSGSLGTSRGRCSDSPSPRDACRTATTAWTSSSPRGTRSACSPRRSRAWWKT